MIRDPYQLKGTDRYPTGWAHIGRIRWHGWRWLRRDLVNVAFDVWHRLRLPGWECTPAPSTWDEQVRGPL